MPNNFSSSPRCSTQLATPTGISRLSPITAFFILAMTSTTVLAQTILTVLYDNGPTVPIGQFYSSLVAEAQPAPGAIQPSSPIAALFFPVHTTKMTPGLFTGSGRVTQKSFLLHPIFFVGDDPISRNWLTKNKVRLQQSKASGLAVNVDNYDRFKALQQLIPGVPIAPSSADEVAKTLGIKVYPAIVTIDGSVTQEVQ